MSEFIDMEYLQELHEQFMDLDAVKVEQIGPETVFDRDTGDYVAVRRTVYEGDAMVVMVNSAQPHVVGGRELAVAAYEIQIPIGEEGVAPNMVCTITDSSHNPAQVGTVLRIMDRMEGTYNTAQRFSAVVERHANI